MNAIVMAVIATAIAGLDYVWSRIEGKLPQKHRGWIWWSAVGGLIVAVWISALIQLKKDHQADEDMAALKTTLSNSVAINMGLAVGGTNIAEILFSPTEKTNKVSFTLENAGEFPSRSLFVRITDQTARVQSGRKVNGTVAYERFYGDFPSKSAAELGEFSVDPTITNYFRFDVQALNGKYRENIAVWRATDTNSSWGLKLIYKESFINGMRHVDPPEMRGSIVVD